MTFRCVGGSSTHRLTSARRFACCRRIVAAGIPMDPRIIDLKSTPFSGRRRTRPPIAEVRETVGRCSPCRRTERAKTLCEPLHGTTAKGGSRVGAGLGMLETLERHGIRTLPPVREDPVRDRAAAPVWTSASDPQPEIGGSAVGTAPASRRAGPRPRGAAAGERLCRPAPQDGPSGWIASEVWMAAG